MCSGPVAGVESGLPVTDVDTWFADGRIWLVGLPVGADDS